MASSDTILTHHWKNQRAEQPQSIFLRPDPDDDKFRY